MRGKGFVQFPQINVIHGQTIALQQARNGKHRANTHLIRLTASYSKATENAHGLNVVLLGIDAVHHRANRRTVRQLTGITRRDKIALTAHCVQALQALKRRVRAIALITCESDVFLTDFTRFLVLHQHSRVKRHNLIIKLARFLSRCRALLRDQSVFVLRLTAHVIALCYDIRRFYHRHVQLRLVLHQPLIGRMKAVELIVLHQRNRLHATGHHRRHLLGNHPLRRDSDRLQTRTAKTVDRQPGGGHRQTRTNGRQTRHVLALSALVERGPKNHIFNNRRINTRTSNRVFNNMPSKIHTVRGVQSAAV